MAALSFDFGIGCSFVFNFSGSFFDGRTPGTAIMRHLFPVPLVDIGGVEVSLCAVDVCVVFQNFALPSIARRTELP